MRSDVVHDRDHDADANWISSKLEAILNIVAFMEFCSLGLLAQEQQHVLCTYIVV